MIKSAIGVARPALYLVVSKTEEVTTMPESNHICEGCGRRGNDVWFDDGTGIFSCFCHRCRFKQQIGKLRHKIMRQAVPNLCLCCGREKEPSMFAMLGDVRSWHCKSCELFKGYRNKVEAAKYVQPEPPEDKLSKIRFVAREATRKEKYLICCTRCKEKRNPDKIAVVGGICQFCWLPEERASMIKMHLEFNRDWKGALE